VGDGEESMKQRASVAAPTQGGAGASPTAGRSNKQRPCFRNAMLMCAHLALAMVIVAFSIPDGAWAEQRAIPALSQPYHVEQVSARKVIYRTSFEAGDEVPDISLYRLTDEVTHTGKRSIKATVTQPNQARGFKIPFKSTPGHTIEVSFWVRADAGVRCALWVTKGTRPREYVTGIDSVPKHWTNLRAIIGPLIDEPGEIEIDAPMSHLASPGTAWVDDVELAEVTGVPYTLPHTEDFPALVADKTGQLWLAVVARPVSQRQVRIYRIDADRRDLVCPLEPKGITGIDEPAIAPLSNGCFVAFSAELNGKWQIGYVFVDANTTAPSIEIIEGGGTSNILPAVAAVGDCVCVLWESNAAGDRGIYASWIDKHGSTPAQRISASGANSYNPTIVMVEDKTAFAAWESVRDGNADIYGARYRNGQWEPEQRLTTDPRIERHASLAVRNGEVWMAWEAQSFVKHLVNGITEQRIVVASLKGTETGVPVSLFESVSSAHRMLLRPQVGFDRQGRLWLTARQSMGTHQGWLPLVWNYSGDQWSESRPLWYEQGRPRPVRIVWTQQGAVGAVQRDNLPRTWNQEGRPDWKSEVMLVQVEPEWALPAKPIKTVLLEMPETEFRLQNRINTSSAFLPRQNDLYRNERVTLYWGDLHEHTFMSVCQRDRNPSPHDVYATQRDIEHLDFTAITDHDYNMDKPQWAYMGEQVRNNNDPGRFLTFLAEEWTSDHVQYDPPREYKRYGHHNIIFLDPYFNRFLNSHDGDVPPRNVWDELRGVEFIMIPHQLADTGNCPKDWPFTDERVQPVAEIFQQRGSYEYLNCPGMAKRALKTSGHYLQDAWAQGIIIGVIASGDHGGGRGKLGVWAKELTRESLVEAIRARHTFGTSGIKIALAFRSGDAMMGDKVTRSQDSPIPFHVRAVTTQPIKEIVIFRNNEPVYQAEHNIDTVELDWVDEKPPGADKLWYYVRVQRSDDELAWSSPIWFLRTQP